MRLAFNCPTSRSQGNLFCSAGYLAGNEAADAAAKAAALHGKLTNIQQLQLNSISKCLGMLRQYLIV
jgi:hypothetical protein